MKFASRFSLLAAALLCASAGIPVAGAQTAPANGEVARVMEMLDHTHHFSQAAISPDGTRVAFVESLPGAGKFGIYVRDLDAATGVPRFVTAANSGVHTENDVAWSPDSKHLAFLSDAAKTGQAQLCIADAATAAAHCLTHLKGALASPSWSPDGRSIALLFIENAPRTAGPLAAETPDEGVVTDHPYEQRLAVVDIVSERVRQITPADTYIYEYDWAPDGKQFVATSAKGSGDDNWWIAQLYTIDAATGAMHSVYKPDAQTEMATPRWSPDGKTIAFIGGLMSDEGLTGGDIYTVTAEGGEVRDVTPGIHSSPAWIAWRPASQQILFEARAGGGVSFGIVDTANGELRELWKGDESIGISQFNMSFTVAHDGATTAVVRQSFAHPPEVWAGAVGSWKQVTALNAGLKTPWGTAKSITWTSDNFQVQGWLIYPNRFDSTNAETNSTKKYPMVVSVHGGPAWAASAHWPSSGEYAAFLSSAGYFVFLPNARGSYGQGEAFTRANVRDFGYGDLKDILAGVDTAIASAPIDPNRLGITGWSYGGFMTMWALTQTDRFRAAMAGAGLANWQSYYGENKIDQWMIPYFGASVYDDPAVYAKSSPINYIKNVKTPTLILVGDSDGECPPPQSYEYWHALKTLGVKTEFVIYPHEGHDFKQPEHLKDRVERVTAWFDQNLK